MRIYHQGLSENFHKYLLLPCNKVTINIPQYYLGCNFRNNNNENQIPWFFVDNIINYLIFQVIGLAYISVCSLVFE